MNSLKKMSLFFIIACISQLLCTQLVQAYNNNSRSSKRSQYKTKKTKKQRTPRHTKSAGAAAHYKNNQPQIDNPAAVAGGVAVHNQNEQDAQRAALVTDLQTFCYNNPSNALCNRNTANMPIL